ncbi:MAG: hypothetical protein II857_05160 [Selenomonadaceae bacterium]|nr:hypothetical protein [Selenomonadaceae bacterium]
MSDEERTKRKVSFDQIPGRQRASLEAQLPKGKVGCGCLVAIVVALFIAFNFIFGDDDEKKSAPPPKPKVEQTETKIKEPEPVNETPPPATSLGINWIKDGNGVYLWNPKPQDGETITWSGGYVQDGNNKFADGAGITTWYLDGQIEQIDEGTFRHGQRHGRFTHKFPSGRIIHSNWDNGIEIAEPETTADDANDAKQTFINYHRAITEKNYRAAYETLSYKQRERVGDFNSYVAGFKDTISSEVSDIKLVSSDEDSQTFDYTLTARDRYHDGRIKIQVFNGQVTMAKDKGRWYVRHAKSTKIDERIE